MNSKVVIVVHCFSFAYLPQYLCWREVYSFRIAYSIDSNCIGLHVCEQIESYEYQ